MKFLSFSQTKLGSSLSLPAHGWVGARATPLFSAVHFAKQNTNSVGVQSEGAAERGVGEFRLARAEAKPRRPARSEQRSAKSFFLLEEKIGRAQIKNCEENFLLDSERSERRRGGAFKIRRSDFRQRMFELRPETTAKYHILKKQGWLPRGFVVRH